MHEYHDVDHRIVHGSIRTALERYADYVEAVQLFLEERAGER